MISDLKSEDRKISVLFLPLYDKRWASSRYRVYYYIPILEKKGISCGVIEPPGTNCFARFLYMIRIFVSLKKFHAVFIQKKVFKKFILFLIHKINPNIIFDFDDALFAKPTSVNDLSFDINKKQRSLNYTLKKSGTVVVGNQFLKDYAIRQNPNIYILPTPVLTDHEKHPEMQSDKLVTIGWVGNHENLIYLRRLENVFKRLQAETDRHFVLKVISDEPLNINAINVINIKWSLDKEYHDLDDIDIGIMPLSDDDWSKGKCAFKILQFMSMSVPVIASPVGMNNDVIIHSLNGFLAEDEDDWIYYLLILINNKDLRNKMGNSGSELVKSKYTYEINSDSLIKILTESMQSIP